MLADRLGTDQRGVGVVAALVCAVALVAGAGVLSFVPKLVVGGVIVFIGLDFLLAWLVESRRRLPPAEFLVVLLIFMIAALVGFLEGVAIGLLAGFVLFVVSYSRAGVVRHRLTGENFRSNVDRPRKDGERLRQKGHQILILVLDGYMFFGTAHRLLSEIEHRIGNAARPVRFLVLDFRLVSGADSSAVHSFAKLQRLAEARGFTIVLCELAPSVHEQFHRAAGDIDSAMPLFADLDHGVEWCERKILESEPGWIDAPVDPIAASLAREFADAALTDRVVSYFERLEIGDGTVIIDQGTSTREMFFVEEGRVAVYDDDGTDAPRRLRSILAGNVVGEVGLYLGMPRTATVVAEGACVLQRLSGAALDRMEREEHAGVGELHKFVLRRVALRLVDANRLLRALRR